MRFASLKALSSGVSIGSGFEGAWGSRMRYHLRFLERLICRLKGLPYTSSVCLAFHSEFDGGHQPLAFLRVVDMKAVFGYPERKPVFRQQHGALRHHTRRGGWPPRPVHGIAVLDLARVALDNEVRAEAEGLLDSHMVCLVPITICSGRHPGID